jgi:hypothetical protein
MRNLSRVAVGLSELPPVESSLCLRFLRAYLAAAGDAIDWKTAWRPLQFQSARRVDRKLRKAA